MMVEKTGSEKRRVSICTDEIESRVCLVAFLVLVRQILLPDPGFKTNRSSINFHETTVNELQRLYLKR